MAMIIACAVAAPFLTGGVRIQDFNQPQQGMNGANGNLPGAFRPVVAGPAVSAAADRGVVARAEAKVRENVVAIQQLTAELGQIKDNASAREAADKVKAAGDALRQVETNGQETRVGRLEMIVLKHTVGSEMIAALTDLKQQYSRIQAIPGLADSATGERLANIEKSIAYWSIGAGEESPPALSGGAIVVANAGPGVGGPPPGLGAVGPGPLGKRVQGPSFAQMPKAPMGANMPRPGNPFGGPGRGMGGPFGKRARMGAIPRPGNGNSAVAPAGGDPLASRTPEPTKTNMGGLEFAKREIPADADPVTRSLIELENADNQSKKRAAQRLERTTPDDQVAAVVTALLPILNDDDGFLVSDVIKALAVWHTPEVVPALIERLSDNRFNVRHEAIKALGKIKDVKAVEPLIERFSEDGFQVEAALKDMGPIAEPALITRLRDRSADVRRKVCKVLEEIGGKDTLKAMDALPQDPDLGTRMAAANAYKQILARVGPASRGSKSRIPAGTR
jgi:hypothetical protein